MHALNEHLAVLDGTPAVLKVNSAGRGTCGQWYSLRITQNIPYEKDYGIKMYNPVNLDEEDNALFEDENKIMNPIGKKNNSDETKPINIS